MLRGLPVYPRVDIAFFPSEVSSYAVGGKLPFPPFVADGAFGDSQDCGYIACGQHAVGTAESARLRAPPPIGVHLFRFRIVICLMCRGVSPPLAVIVSGYGAWL